MAYVKKPLAAYSMGEYESLTRQGTAEFRKAGARDKKKRKSHGMGLGMKAGIAGGVLAGSGAAIRYGGAELDTSQAKSRLNAPAYKATASNRIKDRLLSETGGAKGQLSRDLDTIKSAPGRGIEGIKKAPGEAKKLYGKIGETASGIAKGGMNKLSKIYSSGGGKIALGLGAAGAIGAGGYGAYKLLNRNKKKK